MIEKPIRRDGHRFSGGKILQNGGQFRWDSPLAHARDRVLVNLPEGPCDLDPWAGLRVRDELDLILEVVRHAESEALAGADVDQQPILPRREPRVVSEGFEKRGNAWTIETEAENFLFDHAFLGEPGA